MSVVLHNSAVGIVLALLPVGAVGAMIKNGKVSTMKHDSILTTIGNTPLVKLQRMAPAGINLYVKIEAFNPGGSVKDRTALGIIRAAEAAGELQPGATIVEGTAGNTGIGLTILANALGYQSTVVMPMTQSKEKIDSLELYGADLHLVPATSYDDPNHYTHTAMRLAEKMASKNPAGAIWANQFGNTANRDFHYETTGAEIFQQTEGKLDGFICAVGTGGTLGGVARRTPPGCCNRLVTIEPAASNAASNPALRTTGRWRGFASTKPWLDNLLTASRTTVRLIPNAVIKSRSAGSGSPSARIPA